MPEGSSSAHPVINPGPKSAKNSSTRFFEGSGITMLDITETGTLSIVMSPPAHEPRPQGAVSWPRPLPLLPVTTPGLSQGTQTLPLLSPPNPRPRHGVITPGVSQGIQFIDPRPLTSPASASPPNPPSPPSAKRF